MEQQTFIELLLCAKLCSQLCEAPKVTRYHSHLGDIFGKVTKVHRSQLYTASNQPSLCSLMVGLSFPLCPWRLRCDLLGSHRWSPDSNPVSSVCWCETFGQTWRKPRLPHLLREFTAAAFGVGVPYSDKRKPLSRQPGPQRPLGRLWSVVAVASPSLASLSGPCEHLPSSRLCTSPSLFLQGWSRGSGSPLRWGLKRLSLFSGRPSPCRCSGGREKDAAQQVGLAAPRLLPPLGLLTLLEGHPPTPSPPCHPGRVASW